MSRIKNDGLNRYGDKHFEQQQFGTADVDGVKTNRRKNARRLTNKHRIVTLNGDRQSLKQESCLANISFYYDYYCYCYVDNKHDNEGKDVDYSDTADPGDGIFRCYRSRWRCRWKSYFIIVIIINVGLSARWSLMLL